jgi:hypothetical protein
MYVVTMYTTIIVTLFCPGITRPIYIVPSRCISFPLYIFTLRPCQFREPDVCLDKCRKVEPKSLKFKQRVLKEGHRSSSSTRLTFSHTDSRRVDVREEFRVMKWIYNELLYFAKFVRRISTRALSAMDTIPSRALKGCDYDQAHFRPCIL